MVYINVLKGDGATDDEVAVRPLDAVKEKWPCQTLWAATNASSQATARDGEKTDCALHSRRGQLWLCGSFVLCASPSTPIACGS